MKRLASVLCVGMVFVLLAGCGADAVSSGMSSDGAVPVPEPQEPTALTLTLTNGTDFAFDEIYISPVGLAQEEGLLGSGKTLEPGGSVELTLEPREVDSYDLLVVDQDEDHYLFRQVALKNGVKVKVSFEDGLMVELNLPDGSKETVVGLLETKENREGGGESPESAESGSQPGAEKTESPAAEESAAASEG